MKRTILTIIFLLFLIFTNNLHAQELPASPKQDYKIEKVYPNPVKDQVSLELESEKFATVQFQLIDILGNKVKQWKKVAVVPGNQKIQLNLQEFNSGFYFLRVNMDNQIVVKRIRKL